MPANPGFGALVISLDLEMCWGVRDWCTGSSPYMANIRGERQAALDLLGCFQEREIAATWATVGLLYGRSRSEVAGFLPPVLPKYIDSRLNPYDDQIGDSEEVDPLHLAGSLVDRIRSTPGQEIATHTFSHFYCLEPGQTLEAFEADIASAVAIAAAHEVRLKSLVFPRNQVNPAYLSVLLEHGIKCYRGDQSGWLYRSGTWERDSKRVVRRALRLADSYINLSGSGTIAWAEIPQPSGLCNIPASRFLRPYAPRLRHLDNLRLERICRAVDMAARENEVFHLWWHPHNFGVNRASNMSILGRILDHIDASRSRFGLRSMTMSGVGDVARSQDWDLRPR